MYEMAQETKKATTWDWTTIQDWLGDLTGGVDNLFNDTTNDKTLNQSEYDFSYRTFPSDLASGGTPHQHYMVININVRDSKVSQSPYAEYVLGPEGSIDTFTVLRNEMSKTDILRYNLDPLYTTKPADGRQPLGGRNDTSFPLIPRFTRRIKESIAIFMPQSLQFTDQHEYQSIDVMTQATEIVGSIVNSGTQGPVNRKGWGALAYGADFLGGAAAAFIEKGGTAAALAQVPLNPMTEILFRTTPQRQFVFDFLMAPTSRKDSVAMDQIYKVLKFHARAELKNDVGIPLYRSPSEVDITFFHRGRENLAIPRINTCVIERIDMDYSPSGVYATFSNGAPVMARMTLMLRELESQTKLRSIQGF